MHLLVESSEGQGSNFIVDLPLSEIAGRKKPVAKKTVSLERLQGLKVLLAEDVGINALIMKSVLEFRGCIVTIAANGKEAVEALAKIAGVDYKEYGLAMLKAGTNIDDKSEEDLIDLDAKSFELNGHNVRVAQINVVDLADALKRKEDFLKAMEASSKDNNYDMFMLLITNILDSDSEALVVGSDETKALFEKAFNTKLEDSEVKLPGVVSRKKQVVPPLTDAFNA